MSAASACFEDYNAVGRMISRADFALTRSETSRGGFLSFSEAGQFQAKIDNQTYNNREAIRANESNGDVEECHRLRDSAEQVINQILKEAGVSR